MATDFNSESYAAIVLCGGQSSRMGYPKPMLPFGNERMLQRVVRILRELLSTCVVVAAKNQELPKLPESTIIAHDARESQGPLEGMMAGLKALPSKVQSVFVTSCDVPLLKLDLVRYLFNLIQENPVEIVVPKEENFFHPLTAVYRTSVQPELAKLLREDRRRPIFLFEVVATHSVPIEDLRAVDPHLESFFNLNRPQDYASCLQKAGFAVDPLVRNHLNLD